MKNIRECKNHLDEFVRLLAALHGQGPSDYQVGLFRCLDLILAGRGGSIIPELAQIADEYASEGEEESWVMFLRGFALARLLSFDEKPRKLDGSGRSWAA
jgi:hypothetical protein